MYGIPWPEVAVPLTGVIELFAIALIAVGLAGRLGAAMLVVGMIVVAVTAGSNPFSIVVFAHALGFLHSARVRTPTGARQWMI